MLNVDHQVSDGIGTQMLLGRYLVLLAVYINNPQELDSINWTESYRHLSPPWITIMNGEQVLSGDAYIRQAAENQEALLNTMVFVDILKI